MLARRGPGSLALEAALRRQLTLLGGAPPAGGRTMNGTIALSSMIPAMM